MARGSIIKRGDVFRIAVELPPDPLTNERRQRWETFRGTRKDAEKRLTELLSEADKGKLSMNPKATLKEYLDRWLTDYASAKAPKTHSRYRQLVHGYVNPHLGNVRLDKLTAAHVVRLEALLRETERQDGKGKLSAQTIQHVHRLLHTAFECAVQWQVLSHNPMERLKVPTVAKTEMQAFDVKQARAFLKAAAAEGVKWEAFFALGTTTGLRLGEIKGLRWTDLDLDGGIARVQQTFQRVPGVGRVFRTTKTAGSRRPVALDSDVVVLLRQQQEQQAGERRSMGPFWTDHGLVFPSSVGTPLEDKSIHQVFTRICHRASVPRIRPYDLRHSCASLLLVAGVSPKIVAERLGHASVNLTLNTYSHVLPILQKDAAETLRRLLKGTPQSVAISLPSTSEAVQ